MGKNFFILGTDTDIGKTYISSLLYKELKNYGCTYYKPVQSGSKNSISPDVDFLCKFNGIEYENSMCGYNFEYEVSPHLAAEKSDIKIEKNSILNRIEKLKQESKFSLIEGAGGIYVPLIRGEYYNFDLIKDAELPVILVCSTKVGTINHTLLTIEFLKQKKIKLYGVIFNRFTDKEYEKDNIDVILNDGKIENYLIVDLGQENIEEKKLKNFFKLGE